MTETKKRTRAKGAGRKRGKTLPPTGQLVQIPPVKVPLETLERLKSQPGAMSDFIRAAIAEKWEREKMNER